MQVAEEAGRAAALGQTTALGQLTAVVTSKIGHVVSKIESLTQAFTFVKELVQRNISLNVSIYHQVMALRRDLQLQSRIERSLIQEPFVLEDALGRVAPVHLQFIISWAALQAVMELRFEGLESHEKIKRQEFVLLEPVTGLEINRNRPWEGTFRPGQKINMALTFERKSRKPSPQDKPRNFCPHCGMEAAPNLTVEIQWYVAPATNETKLISSLLLLYAVNCAVSSIGESRRSSK